MKFNYYWRPLFMSILALAIGSGLFAGAITAPVVFHANDYIAGAELTRYEMGSLMSEIFRRLTYIVNLSVLVIVGGEIFKLAMKRREWLGLAIGVAAVISGLLFSFYFVPEILAMQQMGPEITGTERFEEIHENSELWFKLYIVSASALFVKCLIERQKER